MNKYKEMYRKKLTTAEKAVELIKSSNICGMSAAVGETPALLRAMGDREDLSDIKISHMNAQRSLKYLSPEMSRRFRYISWFTSPSCRTAVQEGRADYVPCFYHEIPKNYIDYWDLDIFMGTASPMDNHGWFSFGASVSEAHAMKSKSKIVILEVNKYMPRVLGQSMIHISEVDALIENNEPLPELPSVPTSEADIIIGESIAEIIEDGSTIQLGIGGVPNAVAKALCNKKDLGIHSEMFTGGMVDMIEAGAVTNSKKNLHQGKSIATFTIASRRVYDFIDDNLGVEFYPVSYVNDPNIIAAHDKMVSINACLQVDLIGQVCSESIGPRQFSATGGQVDFIRGAARSKGGKAFITTHSSCKNGTISKIVPMLTQGAVVTTSKNDVDYIVTEYGVAKLKGKTARERAQAMISIAHPDFREELRRAAQKMYLLA